MKSLTWMPLLAAFSLTSGCVVHTMGPHGETLRINGKTLVDHGKVCGNVFYRDGLPAAGRLAKFVFRYKLDGLSQVERPPAVRLDADGHGCSMVYFPRLVALKELEDIESAKVEIVGGRGGAGILATITHNSVTFDFEIDSEPSYMDPIGLSRFLLQQILRRGRAAELDPRAVSPSGDKALPVESIEGGPSGERGAEVAI